MAVTTLKAIVDRFQAVLEGGDLNYKKSTEEFSFDLQPNTRVDTVYRIQDDGLSESSSLTNNVDARVDGLSVWIARKATPDSQAVRETILLALDTIERKIVADGPAQNFHATITGREVERVGDVIMARLGISVDYDFSLSTS